MQVFLENAETRSSIKSACESGLQRRDCNGTVLTISGVELRICFEKALEKSDSSRILNLDGSFRKLRVT
jgi:hypothetical protein